MENLSQVTDMLSYEVAEVEAYVQLFHYIRNEVIPNKKVIPVAQLTEKLETFMSSKGEALKTASKKNIRRRLESELGSSIHIFSNDSGKLLLVPDSLLFKDVVVDNDNLRKELAIWKGKLTDANRITDQASPQIRKVIRRDMKPPAWPCHPSDLSNAAEMPSPATSFSSSLLVKT